MKKDYIRNEDGSLRRCDKNIAKMSIWELVKYDFVHHFFQEAIELLRECLKEFLYNGYALILNLVSVILFPIILVTRAVHRRKNSRYYIDRFFSKKEKG